MARRLSFSEFMTHRATLAAEAVVAALNLVRIIPVWHSGQRIGKTSAVCAGILCGDILRPLFPCRKGQENARAVGFYEHMGFQPYAGTE